MVERCLISEEEREELRVMAEHYWMESMPHAPVVQDPVRHADYFDKHFQLSVPDLGVSQCGEALFDGDTVEMIEQALDTLDKQAEKMRVMAA